ncbi:hypothetical protein B0H16DRAFT_1685961, partial [Mycena metata]
MAAMLSPEESTLVIFGSILDSQVHEAAKLLANESHFTVIVRPLNDDPTKKWCSETNLGGGEELYTDSLDACEGDDTSLPGSEDETESTESDAASLNLGSGVYRLRGGSGKGTGESPGPCHDLDIHLQLKHGETQGRVEILFYLPYPIHNGEASGHFFYAFNCQPVFNGLPNAEYLPSNTTAKPVEMRDGESGIFIPPITPKWIVNYKDGARGWSENQSFFMQDVAYTADTITNDPPGRMEVKFSMGIDVRNRKEPDNHDLPKMSFMLQNLTFLFIPNKDLRAQGYGMAVVTSVCGFYLRVEQKTEHPKSYIPDIRTNTGGLIVQFPVVEVAGESLNYAPPSVDCSHLLDSATTDLEIPVLDAGSLPVSLRFPLTPDTSNQFARYLGCRKEGPGESQLLTVPLHEIGSRGWDIMTEQWKDLVFPKWDDILWDMLKDQTPRTGNMKLEANTIIFKETQREPGKFGQARLNTIQDETEEERTTDNPPTSRGKRRDPALQAEGAHSNIPAKTSSSRKHPREKDDDITEYRPTRRHREQAPPAEGTWEQSSNRTDSTLSRATHMVLPQQFNPTFNFGPILNFEMKRGGVEIETITGGFGGNGGRGNHT